MAAFMAKLRMPLLPWQAWVLDVALERDRYTGLYAYDQIVIKVGRRAGKTRLNHGVPLTRAHLGPVLTDRGALPYRAAYTAQGVEAGIRRLTETWELYADAMPPAITRRCRQLRGRSSAAIEWDYRHHSRRGELNPRMARLSVFAPTPHSLRGDKYLDVTVDECGTLTAAEGQAILEAIRPTLAETHGHSQTWLMSNEIPESAGWLPVLTEAGRAAADDGRTEGIAYFEWSAADDADPTDPAVWAGHPAYGTLLTEAAMRRELEVLGVDAFAREYLNMSPPDGTVHALNAERWAAAAVDPLDPTYQLPGRGRLTLAADVAVDRTDAAVCAAWYLPDGRIALSVVEHRAGAAWLPAAAAQHATRWRSPVAYDTYGPAVDLGDSLARHRVETHGFTTADYAAACAGLVADLDAGRLVHFDQPALTDAVRTAATRALSDRWVWDRRHSPISVAPLVAATLARARALAELR